jgi:hypothetical protein
MHEERAPTPNPHPHPHPHPTRHFRYGTMWWFPWLMAIIAPVRVLDAAFGLRFGLWPARAAKPRGKAA